MSDITLNISSAPFLLLSEKASMDDLLNRRNIRQPLRNACREVFQHDIQGTYVVFDLSHYKERTLGAFQHEFVVFSVRRHGQPANSPPILIKVERSIRNHTIPARIGLWGPADDTLTILPPGTNFPQQKFRRVHQITWQVDHPSLLRISRISLLVHTAMPDYRLLKTSCYGFACAITQATHLICSGIVDPQPRHFLARRSHFMGILPAGVFTGQRVAEKVVRFWQELPGYSQGQL